MNILIPKLFLIYDCSLRKIMGSKSMKYLCLIMFFEKVIPVYTSTPTVACLIVSLPTITITILKCHCYFVSDKKKV